MKLICNVRHALIVAFLLQASALHAQSAVPSLALSFGTQKSAVAKTYGTPFQRIRITPSDHNGKTGVPIGLWDVYHLTTSGGHMYVTMLHFGLPSTKAPQTNSPVVDSLMLMPDGDWTVTQILDDQPAFGTLCSTECDVVRTTDKSGTISLLLRPQASLPETTVLYFEGDSGSRWKSVSSLQSVATWVYELRLMDFESHHMELNKEVIGTWHPTVKNHK